MSLGVPSVFRPSEVVMNTVRSPAASDSHKEKAPGPSNPTKSKRMNAPSAFTRGSSWKKDAIASSGISSAAAPGKSTAGF